MKDVIVDTTIIIEYLKTGKGLLPSIYEKYKMKISTTTFTELLASTTFKDENLENEVRDFVKKYFEVVNIDEATALESARILRDHEVSLATSNIAAYAKVKSIPVATDSKKDYEKIEGVEILEV